MNKLRRRGLALDDPLAPSRAAEDSQPPHERPSTNGPRPAPSEPERRTATNPPAPTRAARKAPPPTSAPDASRAPALSRHERASRADELQARGEVWRQWTGPTGVGSFRLPHELLAELGEAARELQLPVGMLVTAAIAQLLDQSPDAIVALVDRADDARIQGRRRTRRRTTNRAEQ